MICNTVIPMKGLYAPASDARTRVSTTEEAEVGYGRELSVRKLLLSLVGQDEG